ncbi:SGT1 disease resistance protein homolog1 [Zea mays]|uniref:SGT1 disease resistance protein homolog1 n=1 Tax=Zea mays TaxID=4577 RepID=A0A1D6NI99_MAIZE|nr:SGT1 disease resistance protein homolog1 [Zea mays]
MPTAPRRTSSSATTLVRAVLSPHPILVLSYYSDRVQFYCLCATRVWYSAARFLEGLFDSLFCCDERTRGDSRVGCGRSTSAFGVDLAMNHPIGISKRALDDWGF